MSDLSASARIYGLRHVARHRILLQHAANRAVIGALAVLLPLVGFGILNAALFLILRPALGDAEAAIIHVTIGTMALVLT